MSRPKYKCAGRNCEYNVNGICTRRRFDLCRNYKIKVYLGYRSREERLFDKVLLSE